MLYSKSLVKHHGRFSSNDFELQSREPIALISADLFKFRHKTADLEVIAIVNKDKYCRLGVGSLSRLVGNAGLNHMVEHLKDCRWQRLEGIKDAMTALRGRTHCFDFNAQTRPGIVFYHIGSQVKADFSILSRHSLETAFSMALNKEDFNSEIFKIRKSYDGSAIASGPLLNEMRGYEAIPDEVIRNVIIREIYKGTAWGLNLGGDTELIPNITFDKVLERANQMLHDPWRVFLYGDIDLQSQLEIISEASKLLPSRSLKMPASLDLERADFSQNEIYLPLPQLRRSNCATVAISWVLPEQSYLLINLLDGIVLPEIIRRRDNQSSLYNKLRNDSLAEQVDFEIDHDFPSPRLTIFIHGCPDSKIQDVYQIVFEHLKQIADNGVSELEIKRQIKSLIEDRKESLLDDNRGEWLMELAIKNWGRGAADPLSSNLLKDLLDLKKAICGDSKLVSRAIEDLLLENTKTLLVVAKNGKTKKLGLTKISTPLTDIGSVESKKNWKQLDRIGVIGASLSELSPIKIQPKTLCLKDEPRVIYRPMRQSQITYDEPGIISDFVWKVPIRQRYQALNSALFASCLDHFNDYGEIDNDQYRPDNRWSCDLSVSTLAIGSNAESACLNLVVRGFGDTNARQRLSAYVNSIVNSPLSWRSKVLESAILDELYLLEENLRNPIGHYAVAQQRASALLSAEDALEDMSNGIGYFRYLLGVREDLATSAGSKKVINNLQAISNLYFGSSPELVNLSSGKKDLEEALIATRRVLASNNKRYSLIPDLTIESYRRDEGFIVPGQVGAIAVAYDLKQVGLAAHGSLEVAQTLLEIRYMWDHLREGQGAYGVDVTYDENTGIMAFGASCLVDLDRAFEAIDKIVDDLCKLKISSDSLDGIKKQTLSLLQSPQDDAELHHTGLENWLRGRTQAQAQRYIQEILDCDLESLRKVGKAIRAARPYARRVVIAPSDMIKYWSGKDYADIRDLFNVPFRSTKSLYGLS